MDAITAALICIQPSPSFSILQAQRYTPTITECSSTRTLVLRPARTLLETDVWSWDATPQVRERERRTGERERRTSERDIHC